MDTVIVGFRVRGILLYFPFGVVEFGGRPVSV